MKILFIGVFDAIGKSTNTSQLMAFKSIGCEGCNGECLCIPVELREQPGHRHSISFI